MKSLFLGTVTSPNYPENYPNSLDETKTIQVDPGLAVFLEFTAFDLEHQSSCPHDHLTITDGDGTILMKKSCGPSLPDDITSQTNIVKLTFHTDRSVARGGWSIKWRTLTPPGRKLLHA